ncbi:MAG: hypothetical protein QF733_04525 [Phycisphaerales bacterium]|nr:hypothetical protein [Phycisphaerales bacterium]
MAISLLGPVASAAPYDLTPESTLTLAGTTSTDLEGTLIGNYDAESNPDGTQTIPGVWGGSGNTPIPMSLTLSMGFDDASNPDGLLHLEIDDELGVAHINGLAWNVLPETVLPAELTATILYETFHTVSPESLYPGGTPVDIPIGEASVTACTITQTAPGIGTATAVDDIPGAHDLIVAVPTLLDVTVTTEALGVLPLQMPIVLNVEGRHQIGDATNMLTMTASASFDESGDLPGEPLPTMPVDLPTVIPPGQTASLLLDLTPTAAATSVSVDGDMTATHMQGIPGDVNGDGTVNTDDLLAVIAAYGPCGGCPADLDGDGIVGVTDILIVIDHWTI